MKYLVVVDMQNDFINGSLGTAEAQAIVGKVAQKISEFDGMVVVTHDTHNANYLKSQEGTMLPIVHCVDGTAGWKLNRDVIEAIGKRHDEGTPIKAFSKPTFGSVRLSEWLVNRDCSDPIEEVVFIGLCTDICVISNAVLVKAFLPEVKITVDAACCAGVTPESHKNAINAMKMCQVNIENQED